MLAVVPARRGSFRKARTAALIEADPGKSRRKYSGRSATSPSAVSTPTLTSCSAPTAMLTSTVVRPGARVRLVALRCRSPVAEAVSQVMVAATAPAPGLRRVRYSWKPDRVVPSAKRNVVAGAGRPGTDEPPPTTPVAGRVARKYTGRSAATGPSASTATLTSRA